MFCQATNNPTVKDIQLTSKYSRSLLAQQAQVIDKLLSTYQQYQRANQKYHQLTTHKLELEKVRLVVNSREETEVTERVKRLRELQQQCAQKENELAAVKKVTLSNAASNKITHNQCQQLRKAIKEKQQQHNRLVSLKKENILSSNQTQTFLKKINFEIKQQHIRKLSLKQTLAKVRQQGIEIRSANDLQAQIEALEHQRGKMEQILRDLRQV